MGTRHLTIVKHDGKIKLAQYGQWDGYPSGQGANILRFIRGESKPNRDGIPVIGYDKALFIEGLAHLVEASEESMRRVFKELRIKMEDDGHVYMTLEENARYAEKYPALSRDTGSDVLKVIQQATKTLLVRNELDFGKDALMCEFVWLLDLDTDRVEMYHSYPGNMIASYSTLTPPTEEEFLAVFEPVDEENE